MLRVGFHYLIDGVDREAVGVLSDFSRWTTERDNDLDAALVAAGADGKHGDRDCVTFAGHQLVLVEAQQDRGTDWQIYVYDRVSHHAQLVPITTPAASVSFANPSITVLNNGSGPAIVVSLFLPLSGAAPTEVGELVQYNDLVPNASLDQCG